MFRKSSDEINLPAAFLNGYADGQAARVSSTALTAYVRVGIDEYAKGFRAGFYSRTAPVAHTERPAARQVVNL